MVNGRLDVALLGLGLAFAYCIPPGPVTAEAFRQAIQVGWRGAFGIEIGSVIGDSVYGALALGGLGAALRVAWAREALGVLGVGLLLYLGWRAVWQARGLQATTLPETAVRKRFWSAFGVGAGLSLANPMAIPFWLSFGSAALLLHGRQAAAPWLWAFFASFVGGCVLWALAASLGFAYLRRYLKARLFRTISLASGLALIGFAVATGVSLLGR